MEINQYDQYIPNKELDTNFRISRKRTADESLGNYNYQQQSMLNYPNPTKIPAYGYDYKNVSSIPTPMDSGNTSFAPGQVTNTNQTGMVEYPMRQMSSNFNKGTEVERDGPLWLGDSNNKSLYNQNNTGSYGATNQNDSMWTRRYDSKGFQVQPDASTDRSNSAGMINNQQGNWDNMSGGYKKDYYNSGSGAAFQNQRGSPSVTEEELSCSCSCSPAEGSASPHEEVSPDEVDDHNYEANQLREEESSEKVDDNGDNPIQLENDKRYFQNKMARTRFTGREAHRQSDSRRTVRTVGTMGHDVYLDLTQFTCWSCGMEGHSRAGCTRKKILFCSRCGLIGTLTRDCPCRSNNKNVKDQYKHRSESKGSRTNRSPRYCCPTCREVY